MENIKLERTERTPEIDFNFSDNIFAMRGECYPEDVPSFFAPHLAKLEEHLKASGGQEIVFNFELIYFNSTSAKIVMQLFELFEETAENGCSVSVNWYFEKDDDNMEEIGEEFGEDLETATFNLCAVES